MKRITPFSLPGLLLALSCLTACNPKTVQVMKTFEKDFACSPDDFRELEGFVHKFYSGPKDLNFTATTEADYEIAVRLNQLLANKCPSSVLERCAEGKPKAEIYYDSDELHAGKTVEGPLEAFGVIAVAETTYYTDIPKQVWVVDVTKGQDFKAALECFKKR